jgi:nucleotide-binding universal stress UspA family protein
MYHTILVPLDGSSRAEAILPHVESLAQALHSKVVLLRVVDPAAYAVGLEGMPLDATRDIIDVEVQEAERYLEGKGGELKALGIDVQTSVRYGAITQGILDAADSENADLIAMSSHGRTGLARLVYGSIASGVLNDAKRPLLIVRAANTE